jgi:hypothetical protein
MTVTAALPLPLTQAKVPPFAVLASLLCSPGFQRPQLEPTSSGPGSGQTPRAPDFNDPAIRALPLFALAIAIALIESGECTA